MSEVKFRQVGVVSNSFLQRFPNLPHIYWSLLSILKHIPTVFQGCQYFNILTFQRVFQGGMSIFQYLNITTFQRFSRKDVIISIYQYFNCSEVFQGVMSIFQNLNISTFKRLSREWCQYFNIPISQLFRGFPGSDVNISI